MKIKKPVDPSSPAIREWAKASNAVLQEVQSDACHMAFTSEGDCKQVAMVLTACLVNLNERDAFMNTMNAAVKQFYSDRKVETTVEMYDAKLKA